MFKINQNLRKRVLNSIPEGTPELLGCIMIYNELCSCLEYSWEYYFKNEQEEIVDYYRNPQNLEDIDGEKRKDVTCYTFYAIFQELVESKYPNVEVRPVTQEEDEKAFFLEEHQFATITINDVEYNFDPLQGVLELNDLMNLKYYGGKIRGIWVYYFSPNRLKDKDKIYAELEEYKNQANAIRDKNLNTLASEYVIKKQNELKKLPLEDRFDLFLLLVEKSPKNSIVALNYLLSIKDALFKHREVTSSSSAFFTQYMQMQFVYDHKEQVPRALIFFNKTGFIYDNNGLHQDMDNLEIYDISIKDMKVKPVTLCEIEENIQNSRYMKRNGCSIGLESGWIL